MRHAVGSFRRRRESRMLWAMNPSVMPKLVPLLVVRDAARAIEFYVRALGANEVARYVDKRQATVVSHADLAIGDAVFSVTEEARKWNSDAPPSLGGSPVVLQLQVEDVEAAFDRMREAGAAVVFPLVEFAGDRMGRVRDPFGHLWILIQRMEALSPEETQRRRDAWPRSDPSKTPATIDGSPALPQADPAPKPGVSAGFRSPTADRYWHVPVDALHVGVAASLMAGQSRSLLHWTQAPAMFPFVVSPQT